MKARAGTIDLAPATKWLAGLSGALHAMPALSGIRVEAHEGGLTLAATDLDRWGEVSVEADVGDPGVALVSAAKLSRALGAMRPGGVDLALADDRLRLEGPGTRLSLRTIDEHDWPQAPDGEGEATVSLHASVFASLAARTAPFAKDSHGNKPPMDGVSLALGPQPMAAATDSYRLVVLGLGAKADGEASAICPAHALADAARALKPSRADEVALTVGDKAVGFALGDWALRVRPIAGQYPDIRQVLPERGAHETAVEIESEELAAAVKAVLPAADERNEHPMVTLRIGDGLAVEAGGEGDEARAEAREAETEGSPLDMIFNAAYLLSCVDACGSHRVRIEARDEIKPALILPVGDDKYQTLLMPVAP